MTIIAGVGGSIAVMKQLIEGEVELGQQEVAKLFCLAEDTGLDF